MVDGAKGLILPAEQVIIIGSNYEDAYNVVHIVCFSDTPSDWTKDGMPLEGHVQVKLDKSSITIPKPTETDTGSYTCRGTVRGKKFKATSHIAVGGNVSIYGLFIYLNWIARGYLDWLDFLCSLFVFHLITSSNTTCKRVKSVLE